MSVVLYPRSSTAEFSASMRYAAVASVDRLCEVPATYVRTSFAASHTQAMPSLHPLSLIRLINAPIIKIIYPAAMMVL